MAGRGEVCIRGTVNGRRVSHCEEIYVQYITGPQGVKLPSRIFILCHASSIDATPPFHLFSKKDRGSTVQFSTYLYNTLIRVKRLALNYWVMIKDEYFFLYRSSRLHNNVITTNNDNRLTPNNLYIIVIINLWYETLHSHVRLTHSQTKLPLFPSLSLLMP